MIPAGLGKAHDRRRCLVCRDIAAHRIAEAFAWARAARAQLAEVVAS